MICYCRECGVQHSFTPDESTASQRPPSLESRVAALREWARKRIEECAAQEVDMFGAASAYDECRTLKAVLRILDGEKP